MDIFDDGGEFIDEEEVEDWPSTLPCGTPWRRGAFWK